MATAVEQYFNRLIDHNEATSAVITDAQGGTVVECFGSTNTDENLFASNVVISAQRTVAMMDQLRLGGPDFIVAQYRDQIVVQHVEEMLVITLIGLASKGHSIGMLRALMNIVKDAEAVNGCLESVRKA